MSGRRLKWIRKQFEAYHGRPARRSQRRGEGLKGRWFLGERVTIDEVRILKRRWRAYLRSGRKGRFAAGAEQ